MWQVLATIREFGGLFYLLFLFLSPIVAFSVAVRRPQRKALIGIWGFLLFALLSVVVGLVGARVYYLLVDPPTRRLDLFWNKLLSFRRGTSFFGAPIFAISFLWLFVRLRKQSFREWIDFLAPALLAGYCVALLSCVCAGCCPGKPTDLIWGIPDKTFSHFLHPSKIYDLFITLPFLCMTLVRTPRFSGEIGLIGCFGFCFARIISEMFRVHSSGAYAFGSVISYAQLVAGAFLILATIGSLKWTKLDGTRQIR